MASADDVDGPVIVRMPGVMSGEAVFRGTRVPAETLFVNLAAGDTLDEVLDAFPTLRKADCILALQQAAEALSAAAPTVSDRDWESLVGRTRPPK